VKPRARSEGGVSLIGAWKMKHGAGPLFEDAAQRHAMSRGLKDVGRRDSKEADRGRKGTTAFVQ
jgi:hypothetical protein